MRFNTPFTALSGALLCSATLAAAVPATFGKTVAPVLAETCKACHSDRLASGGLDLTPFLAPSSLGTSRDEWSLIVEKLRAGEMPPKGIPRPPQARIDALIDFVQGEFDRTDRNARPDPGRVVARRLNRYEYSNTIRDLLGVEFHAEKDFPTDDSSYGFDNIGSVLSVSPLLTERYLKAAEKIASRAVAADPLPKPFVFEAKQANQTIRRLDAGTVEATYNVDNDADYDLKFHMTGERPADSAKPSGLGIFMDGKLLKTVPAAAEETVRLNLPSGAHLFRARFLDDTYAKGLTRQDAGNAKKNRFVDTISFTGPYTPAVEPASRRKVLICDPKTGPACVDKIVSALAHRAYRRPVTKTEVASLTRFVAFAQTRGKTVEQGIELAIEAILVSPEFLFRIERDVAGSPGNAVADPVHRLTNLELATRLSYFLWSSMPDDELLGLAESGKLRGPGVLDAQVKRMLADTRSAAIADNFAGQWLELRNLDLVTPDTRKYTTWGPDLRDAMKTETRMFFEHILRENRPITEFLDAKYTFLNDTLATHYGIPGVTGPEFRRFELTGSDQTAQRGGLLGQAGILTISSYPTRTSVVIRGKYVLENILGTPPPPPPPDVPALDETQIGNSATLRQQMEAHRSNPVCASCHSKMDVLGFGLENYDGVGKWRTQDGKFPVDSSGTLPNGKTFTGPAGMRTVLLAELPQFSHCLAEKMLTYSLGRGLEPYDRKTVESLTRALKGSDYRFQTLIYEIVRSVPFQMRRAEVPEKELSIKTKELARK